jgi:hypothetical protein
MEQNSYTTTLLVDRPPSEVFAAINNVRGWWSGEITGETDRPGAEFTYEVPGIHRSRQRIEEFIPERKIVWHVTEATLSFVSDTREWKDTMIVFELVPNDGNTKLIFTHVGLVPEFECYTACSNAWGLLVNGNLLNFIRTGEVQPSPW